MFRVEFKIFLLITILLFITISIEFISIYSTYKTALNEERQRLVEIAQSQARFIEAVARFNEKHHKSYSKGSREATISQIIDAHKNYKGFGESGEFTLAYRKDNKIIFVLSHRHYDLNKPKPIEFNSNLAEPMRRALGGESGSIVGYDYRGKRVLAGYEFVDILNMGVVAKIDLDEVRAPFIKTTTIVVIVSIILIIFGIILFYKLIDPIIKQLRDSEKRFRSTFEQMAVGVSHNSLDGKFIRINKKFCEIVGYSQKEMLLKTFQEITYPNDLNKDLDNVKKILSAEIETYSMEKRYFHKNGDIIWINLTVSLVSRDFKPDYFIAVVEDITDKKRVENELHEKEEMMIAQSRQSAMGDMISMIAHQWRQPLSTIGMSANNMIFDINIKELKEEVFLEHLSVINREVGYLSKTIDDFRNFFKPNREMEFTTFSTLFSKIDEIIGKSLQNHEIELNLNSKDEIEFYTYPNEVIQVLLNIINNSKEAIIDRGIKDSYIKIDGYLKDGVIYIDICDNAGGIKDECRDKIFNPYFTTKDENGTGLGLYMSKVIIEKHLSGNLKFKNYNNGVCFKISFKYLPREKKV